MESNPIKRMLRRFLCPPPKDLSGSGETRVASAGDITEGKPFCASVGGREIAIFKTERGYAAVDNMCPHAGGPLCRGKLEKGAIECPWHGSKFDISSGAVLAGPAKSGVATYAIERRGDDLFVKNMPTEAKKTPKAAIFAFAAAFDKDRPFDHEPFLNELLSALRFPFKLYGILPFVVIAQGPDEIDADLGQVHVTEVDLKKMSEALAVLNAKWGTSVTYCLYHTSQLPGDMLLNVRGSKASSTTENDIKF